MPPSYSESQSSDESLSPIGSEDGLESSDGNTETSVGNTHPENGPRSVHYFENASNFQINGGDFRTVIHNNYGKAGAYKIVAESTFLSLSKGSRYWQTRSKTARVRFNMTRTSRRRENVFQ